MSLHSSLLPRFAPLVKSVNGSTRADEKRAKRAEEAAALKACYLIVDARDQGRCRVCGRRCSPTALALLDRAERHHLVYRSQGGEHLSKNVLTVCKASCHADIHTHGTLRLEGDADYRDDKGQHSGVKVERWLDAAGWVVEKWV